MTMTERTPIEVLSKALRSEEDSRGRAVVEWMRHPVPAKPVADDLRDALAANALAQRALALYEANVARLAVALDLPKGERVTVSAERWRERDGVVEWWSEGAWLPAGFSEDGVVRHPEHGVAVMTGRYIGWMGHGGGVGCTVTPLENEDKT
jgi:hypothetical protein